jgi:hypothetical protein
VKPESGEGPVRTLHRNLLRPIGAIRDGDETDLKPERKGRRKAEPGKPPVSNREQTTEAEEVSGLEVEISFPLRPEAPVFVPDKMQIPAQDPEEGEGQVQESCEEAVQALEATGEGAEQASELAGDDAEHELEFTEAEVKNGGGSNKEVSEEEDIRRTPEEDTKVLAHATPEHSENEADDEEEPPQVLR